jgi:putative methyltransferase (TIGR04325 family)
MPSVRRLAAELAPPALLSLGRRAKQIVRRERPDFQGTYAGFDDIMLEPGAGFTDSSGLEWAVNKARAQSVRSEVVPDTLRLTILLNVLTAADSPVTVIDYGGGAGNTFVSVEPALANPGAVSWTIVELPSVAESARRFLGARATVSEDIDDALSRAKGTVVVVARGALQYHPRPFDVLAAIAGHQPAWVLLTRMPAGGAPRFACVQSFRGHTPQPMWFFNRSEMVAAMHGHGYAPLDHWTEVETFRMPNYPPSQRVSHSVGWIFHRALNGVNVAPVMAVERPNGIENHPSRAAPSSASSHAGTGQSACPTSPNCTSGQTMTSPMDVSVTSTTNAVSIDWGDGRAIAVMASSVASATAELARTVDGSAANVSAAWAMSRLTVNVSVRLAVSQRPALRHEPV